MKSLTRLSSKFITRTNSSEGKVDLDIIRKIASSASLRPAERKQDMDSIDHNPDFSLERKDSGLSSFSQRRQKLKIKFIKQVKELETYK